MAEHYFRPLKRGLYISINGTDDLSKAKYLRGTNKDPGGWLPSKDFATSDHAQSMHLDVNLFPHGKTPVVFEDAVKELLEGKQLTMDWLKTMNAKHRQRFYDGDDDEMTCGFEPLSVAKLIDWMNTFHPGWQTKQTPAHLRKVDWTKGRLTTIQNKNKKRKFETMDGVKSWDEIMSSLPFKSSSTFKLQKRFLNDEYKVVTTNRKGLPPPPPSGGILTQSVPKRQPKDDNLLVDELLDYQEPADYLNDRFNTLKTSTLLNYQ